MKRLAELTVFVALAAALHLSLALRLPSDEGGAATGGQGGENSATVMPASAQIAALIEEWDRPPETAPEVERPDAPPPDPEAPVRPEVETDAPPPRTRLAALPEARADMPQLPQVDPDTPLPPAPNAALEVATPDMPPPPEPEMNAPPAAADSAIRRPQIDSPRPAPTDLAALPQVDGAPPPPPAPSAAPRESLRPRTRPERPPEPQQQPQRQAERSNSRQDSAPRQAQRAAGSGGSAQAGTATRSAPQAMSRGQEQQLVAAWGAQVRARIESRKRHPGGRGGQVVLSLTVTPAGQVAGAGIARSSGNPRLDRAALQAVRSAGRMPRAPQGLTQGSYAFTLPMAFN
ncbi:cell envelope integrity protein TolA [Pseudooceanicola sp.]|uniref:cell envelope integrity protein TolA n=1 Tax=Pseudooceanicola sp. TaxID=1914328 RepID=UPI0040597B1A